MDFNSAMRDSMDHRIHEVHNRHISSWRYQNVPKDTTLGVWALQFQSLMSLHVSLLFPQVNYKSGIFLWTRWIGFSYTKSKIMNCKISLTPTLKLCCVFWFFYALKLLSLLHCQTYYLLSQLIFWIHSLIFLKNSWSMVCLAFNYLNFYHLHLYNIFLSLLYNLLYLIAGSCQKLEL